MGDLAKEGQWRSNIAAQLVKLGRHAEARREIQRDGVRRHPDLPAAMKPTVAALQSILSGSRARALAADPNLHYADAAELHLLLDRLGVAP
jgi:hypothetical protein